MIKIVQQKALSLFIPKLTMTVVVALTLATITLGARTLTAEGLIPVVEWGLGGFPVSTKQYGSAFEILIDNITHLYWVAIDTYYSWSNIPNEYFWVSINPLPGGMVGWYTLGQDLNIINHVPFSAFGQLAAHLWPLVVLYFMLVGLSLGLVDRVVLSNSRVAVWAKLLAIFLVSMAVILSYQYPLRSVARFYYYLGAVSVLGLAISKLRR